MSEPLVVVTACDDNYARGVAATIRSVIDTLPPGRELRIFVLDGGLKEGSKKRLLRSWRRPVEWLTPDLAAFGDLPVSGHVSHSTYLRILLAELVPADVYKAIYLDADVIAIRNLEHLWSIPLDGSYCAAAQDAFVPVLDPPLVFTRELRCMMYGHDPRPIPNYRALGLKPTATYFNAGIMLVNVDRWRQEQVARRAFECLRDNADHVRYWDQYALNTLFSEQWKMLDPRWNQNSVVFRYPTWEQSPYSEAELYLLQREPWIVHFDYKPKPWQVDCQHPFRELFFKYLDRTSYGWWRPRRSLQECATIASRVPGQMYQGFRRWRQTSVSPALRDLKVRVGLKRAA
jgi:lipopolysaccharide biosynthesis glycosyltransferase